MAQQEYSNDVEIATAATVADFALLLCRLRLQAGQPSLRKIQKLTTTANGPGITLSKTTISDILAGKRLPSHEFVKSFTNVCGVDEEDKQAWLDARARIAENQQTSTRVPPPTVVDNRPSRIPQFLRLVNKARVAPFLIGGSLLVVALLLVAAATHRPTTDGFSTTITCTPESCRTMAARLPLTGIVSGQVPEGQDAYLMIRTESTKRWYIGPTIVPNSGRSWSYEVGIGNPLPQDKDRDFTICAYLLPIATMDDLTAKFIAYKGDGLFERDLPVERERVACAVAVRLKQL